MPDTVLSDDAGSITSWVRLEPLPREASMQRSLQAQIRDPLWMLARQWQIGEFLAEDTGSPVHASLNVETRKLTGYAPAFGDPVPYDPALPLETHVERETVSLNLRASMQLGLKFERMARAKGATDTDIAGFRAAFSIPQASPEESSDPVSTSFRNLILGRIIDGQALYQAIIQGKSTPSTSVDLTSTLASFRAFRESLYSEPTHDPAWTDRDLRYEFLVASRSNSDVNLSAPDYNGDRLDWYSMDPASAPVNTPGKSQTGFKAFNFLPQHVTFRGMPGPEWWELEDGQTDFGQLDSDHVDLAKMLVMEFALVFGGDWFEIPIPLEIGSLNRVDSLVVTDTFGERTLVRSTEASDPSAKLPWSMFALSNGQQRLEWMFLPPSIGAVLDAPPIEEVVFLRDDLAAMAWAVEKTLPGPMDKGLDGYESWRRKLRQQPEPPPQPLPNDPSIYYLLETTVPDNWIPLVPVVTSSGAPLLRRGVIERPGVNGPVPIVPRGTILKAGTPFFARDEAVPYAGTDIQRRFRRCRWLDGKTYVWCSRLVRPGRGPGWSGLAYDQVLPQGSVPPEMVPR
jgi:hypothetical protein